MGKSSFVRRYRLLWLTIVLVAVNVSIVHFLPGYRYDSIVLHHSASWADNYATIRDFHLARFPGVRDAAYHLLLSNGSAGVPMGHLEATGRYQNLSYALATKNRHYNLRAVHVCVIGNYDQRPVPQDMQPVIGHALQSLMSRYRIPQDRIFFHRDVSPSACPGRHISKHDVYNWISRSAECPAEIRAQQRSVINHSAYSLWTFPKLFLVLMAAVSMTIIIFWGILFKIVNIRREAVQISLDRPDVSQACKPDAPASSSGISRQMHF